MASSAAHELRAQLRKRRPRLPTILRLGLITGLSLLGVYALLLVYFYGVNRELYEDLMRLYLLTLLAGREPAIFTVYQEPTPLPVAWMVAIAMLDDVATLLVTLPWVWFLVERLRGFGPMQGFLIATEKAAIEHRVWLRRWGLAGLAAFYWLPGLGSGVLAISMMGVLARIPLRLLLPVLVVTSASVALFWAVALAWTTGLITAAETIEYVPLVVVGIVLTLSLVGAWRRRGTRHIILFDASPTAALMAEDLRAVGITPGDGALQVDLHQVADSIGVPRNRPGAARAAARLLICGVKPALAKVWVEAGVTGVHDLMLADTSLLRQVAADEGLGVEGYDVARWAANARTIVSETRWDAERA